jgi:uncharacterized protein (TIGR00251 family)
MDVSDLYRVASEGSNEEGEAPNGVVVLQVHVQPAAGRSAVVGRHGTALKVRVGAAPEGGRANEACAALLAETFGVKTADVELTGGATSRSKQFQVSGLDLEEFKRQLERAVSGALGATSNRPTGKR